MISRKWIEARRPRTEREMLESRRRELVSEIDRLEAKKNEVDLQIERLELAKQEAA